MSGYGKINLLAVILLPVVATMSGVVMFGPHIDIMAVVFAMNAIPMLVGGLISGLLLRGTSKSGGVGRLLTIWPTVLPAVVGIAWYLGDALFPAEQDPGRVYISGPIYLLAIAIAAGFLAWVSCAFVRSRRATT